MARPTNRPPRPSLEEDDGTLLEDEGAPPEGSTVVFDTNAFANEDAAEEQSPDGATVVFNTNAGQGARRPSVTGKLTVTAGPRAGEEYSLGPGDTVIGRQNDCNIVLADISVSRRHVLVRRDGSVFKLQDLGSGNGTFLNGERLEGEIELQDGDVFMMGDSEVTFSKVAPAAPAPAPRAAPARPQPRRPGPASAPPRPAPPRPGPAGGRRPGPRPGPRAASLADDEAGDDMTGRFKLDRGSAQKAKRKKLLIAAAVVGVLMVGLFLWKKNKDDQTRMLQIQEIEGQISVEEEAMVAAIEKGKDATKAGNFRAAVTSFKAALEKADAVNELAGDGRADTPARDAKNRLEYAQKEVANQDIIENAKELILKTELAKAAEALRSVPEDSFFADKVPDLKKQLRDKIPDKLIQGRGLLSSRPPDLSGATAVVEDVLAVDPENGEAKKLSDDIERAGAPKPRPPKPVEQKVDYVEKALNAFKAGKLDEAVGILAVCEEAECGKLADKLSNFKTANEKGSSDALKRCKAIPGCEQSPFFAPLAGKAAGDLVREGIKHMSSEDYCKAFKSFYEALKADPNNAVAGKHMGTIHSKAKELFQQAYVDKGVDAEKARREFEQVVCMTASDDELNQKSIRHMKSLGGGY